MLSSIFTKKCFLNSEFTQIYLLLIFSLKGMQLSHSDESTITKKILMYHKVVEAFKFSYAMRPHLGDPDKVPVAEQTMFNKVCYGEIKSILKKKSCYKWSVFF